MEELMSFLHRLFGKRNPSERYGGTNRLAKDINDICRGWTNLALDTADSQIENFSQQDRMKHGMVAHIALLTLVMREFFKCAELWAPDKPQQFVNELCASVARHEWGSDIDMCNSMFASISMFIQAMIADEKEKKLGKIDSGACLFRACSRPFDLLGEKLSYSLELPMIIALYYPRCVAVNKSALEAVNAVNKDGVYVG
jgi:hypothetical protein